MLLLCSQRVAAENILKAFQEAPEAWTQVDKILDTAQTEQTKFFGLQVRQNRNHKAYV